jgi:hypothetical protein
MHLASQKLQQNQHLSPTRRIIGRAISHAMQADTRGNSEGWVAFVIKHIIHSLH